MPQTLSTRFSAGSTTIGDPSSIGPPNAVLSTEAVNNVGRTMAELEILLAPLITGDDAHDTKLRKWRLGQTAAFIIASCGLFWAAAGFVAWALL